MTDLDANFLVVALDGNTSVLRALEKWLRRGEVIAMSAVAWSEFLCGPLTAEQTERARIFVSRVEAFTPADAVLAAELFNATGRRQRNHADCMIAASAIGRGARLATLDRIGFARFATFQLKLRGLAN
jgi:predicted nucleic acid-binding protein